MTILPRYARQTILPELGSIGQKRLSQASVLCVGAGGLGCPALLYLAGAGVGHIGIIDHDTVDETNLHRQILYTMDDIGAPKAAAAKARLSAINPHINITAYAGKLRAENAEQLCAAYDVIIDGTDNFAAKYLINDLSVKHRTPYIHGAVLGFEGQVAVFDARGGGDACYRCLFAHAPKNNVPNCADGGVIGAAAGIIGTMQAMEAIKIIVNHDSLKPLRSTLFTIDTRTMHARRLKIAVDPACSVCSLSPEAIIIKDNYTMNDTPQMPCGAVREISVADVKAKDMPLLIDVREADEWAAGHIDGAHHLALSELLEGQKTPNDLEVKSTQEIILYCRSGQRSRNAADIFMRAGYTDVYNMTGGVLAWGGA